VADFQHSEIVLESEALRLVLDPGRGAEIRSLVAKDHGAELLFQAPWEPAPLGEAPLSEEAWTASWRGGWQVLFPNAGVPCQVGGRRHGFHGDASVAPWEIVRRDQAAIACGWRDRSGLELEREVHLAHRRVEVVTTVSSTAAEPEPFLLVEHVLLGGALAGDGAVIRLPGGRINVQTWEGEQLGAREEAPAWPLAPVGGRVEDWSRLARSPLSRFGVVTGLLEGLAEVVSRRAGLGVRLTWSLEALPCLWLWEERLGSITPPWNGRTECLAVEPASTSAADGLAGAIERGEAGPLGPGERFRAWIAVEFLDAGERGRDEPNRRQRGRR
jgi:hypothetical protein